MMSPVQNIFQRAGVAEPSSPVDLRQSTTTVLQQNINFNNKPLPKTLIKKASNGWSDSDQGSNKKDENMPKSLAVRGKFIYDPEHGGGRRRRDKQLPT